jgi:Zinc finger, C2H2 type
VTRGEFKCPVCLKPFDDRSGLRQHMKRKRHSIDGPKGFVRETPEHKLAEYHRDKTGDNVELYRFGEPEKGRKK